MSIDEFVGLYDCYLLDPQNTGLLVDQVSCDVIRTVSNNVKDSPLKDI